MIVGAKGGEPRPCRRMAAASPNGPLTDRGSSCCKARSSIELRETAASPYLAIGQPFSPRFSRDGVGLLQRHHRTTRGSRPVETVVDGRHEVSRLTRLEGRRGHLGVRVLHGRRYLYFTWREDDGDIWVMDVVPDVRE